MSSAASPDPPDSAPSSYVAERAGRSPEPSDSPGSADAIRQLGFVAAIGTLGYVFWVVGAMEMIERLAFYGVKAVATLYAKDPVSKGGLGIDMSTFGTILMVWALVQSIVPVFTGGLSDRYGYKLTIFVSTVVKIVAYLTMATFPTYAGFFSGAVLLATGTAIFKPGIQATLVKSTRPDNSSMAWGIFYQTVNIGGAIGPALAGWLRKMAWHNVFYANAGIISVNFLLLCAYREVGKEERLARRARLAATGARPTSLVVESLRELSKRHVWTYLLVFSGFWFMFDALFDVLPAHIDDWVDTSDIVRTLFPHGSPGHVARALLILNKDGTAIQPEGLLNIDAALIMFTCFLFAYLSGKMRATTSMVVGTLLATMALFVVGQTTWAWAVAGAIAVFAVGEMLSSPKFNEFMGNFAPADKKAMYLGFSQMALAVGWTVEGKVGPWLYDRFASKDRFARELLAARGWPAGDLAAIPQGEAFSRLVSASGQSKEALTHLLYQTHHVGIVWDVMAAVGVLSTLGIYLYARWVLGPLSRQSAARGAGI